MSGSAVLTKTRAHALTKTILGLSTVKHVSVRVSSSRTGNTRFANTQPTTTGDVEEMKVDITATVDGRSATVSGNQDDKSSLAELVASAEEMARLSPVDPEWVEPLGPQRYTRVRAADVKASQINSDARASLVGAVLNVASNHDLESAGWVRHVESSLALANSSGLFAFHHSTNASLSTTCRTKDGTGSGRAVSATNRFAEIDATKVASLAAHKAVDSKNPQALDAGLYTVVLEPQAVADLLGFLMSSLGQRGADEGRSFFSKPGGGNRIGEKLFSDKISLFSDPAVKNYPASPIASDGTPLGRQTWIDKGVVESLTCSRYWAAKTDSESVTSPSSLHLMGGTKEAVELVEGVQRGIYVTRFWYNRMLERQTILATGLTRDGTFLIEDGKITNSVKNFRYNDSPVTLLRNVIELGQSQRVDGGRVTVMPSMSVAGFNFSSQSDAV